MRLLTEHLAVWLPRSWRAGPLALAILAPMFGPASPALADRDAPAVWVPLAVDDAVFGSAGTRQPIVLVPFEHTAALPGPARAPMAWAPAYLERYGLNSPGSVAGGSPPSEAGDAAGAGEASFTLSDVVRAADWRRETAARLRSATTFKPAE